MKKNNYSLENNILTLNTECGVHKFRIEESTGLDKARRIAALMNEEMEKIQAKVKADKDKSSPYARLLLANLNLADACVRLEDQYRELLLEQDRTRAVIKAMKQAAESKQVPESPAQAMPSQPVEPEAPESLTLPASKPEAQERDRQADAPPEKPAPQETPDTPERVSKGPAPLVRQVLDQLRKPLEKAVCEEEPMETGILLEADEEEGEEPVPAPSQFKIRTGETPSVDRARLGRPESRSGGQGFMLPPLDFLKQGENRAEVNHDDIRRDAEILEQKLGVFGIRGEVMEVLPGPVITTFEYKPAPGIKISKIVNLADDLALALSALSIRIVAPIPGKDVIGIEIPNARMSVVPFYDIVGSEAFADIDSPTPICLGKDIIGNPVVVGLEKMPHLLIAGATGTGKSVALNAMISSILYKSSPDRVKFIMIDPKRIELSLFNDIPHLITPVITDMKKANIALQWVVREMERRYEQLAQFQVRNIRQYNRKLTTLDAAVDENGDALEAFPYIVVIIDELADLMMTASKDIEFSLTRIAQMARAAGIHLILATQRPSVDVLTGIIKANFPTRISFQVSSKTDSRTIIDANGAETLLGRGDMLFVPPGTARLTRVHGTYLSETELLTITNFLKAQEKPRYLLDVITEKEDEVLSADVSDDEYDEKYEAALQFVLTTRQASISGVQRALRVGYNRAARIIDLMEKNGVVGPSDGVKPRQVIAGNF